MLDFSKISLTGITLVLLSACRSHSIPVTTAEPEGNSREQMAYEPAASYAPVAGSSVPGIAVASRGLAGLTYSVPDLMPSSTVVGQQIQKVLTQYQQKKIDHDTALSRVDQLFSEFIRNARTYHTISSDIATQLQLGSTPRNPYLVSKRARADQYLRTMETLIQGLGITLQETRRQGQELQHLIADTHKAFSMPGGVDEDHAHLMIVDDGLHQAGYVTKKLGDVIEINAQRQQSWLVAARTQFNQLSQSIETGQAIAMTPVPQAVIVEQVDQVAVDRPSTVSHPTTYQAQAPVNTPQIPAVVQKEIVIEEIKSNPISKNAESIDSPVADKLPVKQLTANQSKDATPKAIAPVPTAIKQEAAKELAKAPPVVPTQAPSKTTVATMDVSNRTPLAVIAFERPEIKYKWYAYSAVSRGLEKDKTARFDIIVYKPAKLPIDQAYTYGEKVVASLKEMEIGSDKFDIVVDEQSKTPSVVEVNIFQK